MKRKSGEFSGTSFLSGAPWLPFAVAGFLAAAAAAPPVEGGGIEGKIKAGEDFQEHFKNEVESRNEEREDYYWMVENGVLPVLPPSVDWSADILVALMKKEARPSTGGIESVTIKSALFNPSVIVVKPKTTIKFKNEDPFVHSIYSPDLGQTFAPEILPSRQLRQVQFLNPGIYSISCKMTPHLEGYVIVDPKVAATTSPADDATFTFEEVEPGSYTVSIYYKREVVGRQEVEVVEEDTVELEIEIGKPVEAEEEGKKEEKKDKEAGEEEKEGKAGKKSGEEEAGGKKGKKGTGKTSKKKAKGKK